jgi:large subunit ribosomal protein L18
MDRSKKIRAQRERRMRRTRSRIFGTASAPRLSVFRSNRYLYVQAIDDERQQTVVSVSTRESGRAAGTKVDQARRAGEAFAAVLKQLGITRVIFDRGSYKYQGRVSALADGVRRGGIQF